MSKKHLFLLDNFSVFVYNIFMLKIAMILMLVAVVVLAVGVSLMKKNNALTFLLKSLALIALVGLGFVVANFKDDFSGFSILVILSALPMFLSVFDLKQMLETKDTPKQETIKEQSNDNLSDFSEASTEENLVSKKKKSHKNYLAECQTNLLCAIGIFLSAICISIATLYIGKETFLGAVIGILIGGAVTLVLLALKKIKNPFEIIFYLLIFASIGLMASNIVLAFMYSFSTTNIMFALGCLAFGVYAGLQTKYSKNYLTNIYYASMIFFILSILL